MATRHICPIIVLITLFFLAGGCALQGKEFVEVPVPVNVPVPVKQRPPAELMKKLVYDLPVFVSPDNKAATSGLTKKGETKLKYLLWGIKNRMDGFNAWSTAEE